MAASTTIKEDRAAALAQTAVELVAAGKTKVSYLSPHNHVSAAVADCLPSGRFKSSEGSLFP